MLLFYKYKSYYFVIFAEIVLVSVESSFGTLRYQNCINAQKSGLIEEYLVSLNITNNLLKWKAIETKTNDNYVTVDNYIAGKTVINVTIRSSNQAGVSSAQSQLIDFDVCAISKSGFLK